MKTVEAVVTWHLLSPAMNYDFYSLQRLELNIYMFKSVIRVK
jgi:hypothetical protein